MIIVILPFYNEVGAIYSEIAKLSLVFHKANKEYLFIAVDDGSTDASVDELRELVNQGEVQLVTHCKNMGLGQAMKSGIQKALDLQKADIIIIKDADMTQDAAVVKGMIELIENSGCDLVIASRFIPGAVQIGVRRNRRIISSFGNCLFRRMINYPGVTDYTCNYRAYRVNFMLELKKIHGEGLISENNFAAAAELLLKALELRPMIYEIPLVLRYDKKISKSKINIIRD
ncbi:MAG: glycosyltransferase family 2 protein, partial [Candidatus Omnitrophica bacterium]|nr:glycosyltransferase family 2 protein [Candidatus Omnitrophota bacterium]